MRTMAFSSSNRNSASARASSVLPTPVGPMKRKEPIGRRGSPRPARERRTALATSSSASSWPTTRWRSRSSMWSSFSISPSSMRETGMPVHLETTSAMSSASTSSLSIRCPPLCSARRASSRLQLLLEAGQRAVAQLGGLAEVALPRGLLQPRSATFSICSLRSRTLLMAAFSCCQSRLHGRRTARAGRPAPSRASPAAPARPCPSPSSAPGARSRAGRCAAPPRRSRSAGESISMRRRLAASSIRSMALSGRKRSAM